MNLIDVIPIAKGMSKEHLSYYTSKKVSPGQLVTVPLGKRSVHAIVVSVDKAKNRKEAIKASSYRIKKVTELKTNSFVDKHVVNAAHRTARTFASTTGRVLESVIPTAIRQDPPSVSVQHDENDDNAVPEKYLLQTQPRDRKSVV